MFDVIGFAMDTGLTVAITGVKNENVVGVGVQDDTGYMSGELLMVKQPDETDAQYSERLEAFFDRLYTDIETKRAQHVKNAQLAKQRAELEEMFRRL